MFLDIIAIVAPVFALMGIGFGAAKLKVLPDGAQAGLAQFAFKIAIPAMLFRAMLNAAPLAGSPWRLLAVYLAGIGAIWILASLLSALVLKRSAEEHAVTSMASTFGNTVMLGIPIALMAFGEGAATPVAILVAVEATLLWIVATVQIEFARRGSNISFAALGEVFKDLATNTIILSLALGLAGHALGLSLPAPIDRILALLGQAGVPVALFALGMTLAGFTIAGEARTLGLIAVLKLFAQPALVFVIATEVIALPPLWTAVVTLHTAMPVGANPFLFASRYDRGAATVSAAIALTTVIAVLTVTLVIAGLKGGVAG
jgi:malonate transporter and related proteins